MKYNVGTVAVTNGSTAVVGTATKWATNILAGQFFTVIGSNVFYTVASVTDDTHLVLAATYAGPTLSGLTYDVHQSFTTNYNIPYPQSGDVQIPAILGRAISMIDAELLNSKNVRFTAVSQAAMLALAAKVGDLCRRTDTTTTYWLDALPASTLANWTRIA